MFIRRHLSYANVVATMALVFAMGGSAVAAQHYLITKTNQISPKVLKALETKIAANIQPAATGKEGAAGKEGKPGTEGKEGGTGKEGNAGTEGKEGLSLLSKEEQEQLKAVLPYMKLAASGVDGKPTIVFSGVNVQVTSGETSEVTINGEGNLVVGVNEDPKTQSGSNNLVLGSRGQSFTSVGGFLAGYENTASARYDSVSGGDANTASATLASVSGGAENTAKYAFSAIGGGTMLETAAEKEFKP